MAICLQSRTVCTSVAADVKSSSIENHSVYDERFKLGWYRYLPFGVEPSAVISFAPEVEKQFTLLESNPGNRHLRYDLATLCLRSLRSPLTADHEKSSVLLAICQESLGILSKAEKFKEQLDAQLAKHMTQIQRLDIRTKIGEHKQKLIKNQWMSIPLMAAYAHFLMLDGQLQPAFEVIQRANLINQSLLYFQLGATLEQQHTANIANASSSDSSLNADADSTTISPAKNDTPNLLMAAAIMYCRSIAKVPANTESLTNLAVLEWYHDVDTLSAMKTVESELETNISRSKGYNAPFKKPHVRNKQSSMKHAMDLLQRAIDADTTRENYLAQYHLGFILETAANEPEKAREHYSKALEINPDHMQSHSHLGSLLMDEKMYNKALYHFEQAKILAPNQLLVYLNLANCLGRLGSIEAAMKEMQKAIRRDPTMPHLHYHLAMILVRAKRFEEAIASFERALQLHGLYPQHQFDTGPTYNVMTSVLREMAQRAITDGETADDFESAAKMLARCLDLMPEGSSLFPAVLTSLSFCLMKSNRPEAAIEALTDAIEKGGESFLSQFHQAQQNDANPIVYTQLEQHFTSLERTDALIDYLLPKSVLARDASSTLSPASKSSADADIPKKKISKSGSSKKLVTKKKKKQKEVEILESSNESTALSLEEDHTTSIASEEAQNMDSPIDDAIEDAIRLEMSQNKEGQLEMLLSHKAKLHYNIAFCMHYLGEIQEAKRHLELALESDPACTSDYVIFEKPGELEAETDELEFDNRELLSQSQPDSLRHDPEEATEKEEFEEEDDGEQPARESRQPPGRKHSEPVTASSIRRASRAVPYTAKGMEYQFERLVHPPDGSKMTDSTKALLNFLSQVQEKYKDSSLEALDSRLMQGFKTGPVATRSSKSKRRRDMKYTIEASRRASQAGPDDGFDSPL